MRPACASLHGTHDSLTSAGDQHEAVPDHFARKIGRHFVIGRIVCAPCRSKNDHFSQVLEWRENLCCRTHLFSRTVDQLEIGYTQFVAPDLQRGGDHFLDQRRRFLRAPVSN
jgi:hypothetical protein